MPQGFFARKKIYIPGIAEVFFVRSMFLLRGSEEYSVYPMSSSSRNARKSSRSKSYEKLANRIVNDSLRLKQGESLTIETWNSGLDFAKEVVKEARKAGAIPLLILED